MYRTWIAVVDATRARLFHLDRISEPEGLREELVEDADLVNVARRLRPSELFSETRPGIARVGDVQYGFDDHRDEAVEQLDVQFAREITAALAQRLPGANRLIVCASPRMLGHLRAARGELPPALRVDELSRDLVKLAPAALRDHLVRHGLLEELPPRELRARP